MAPHGACEVVQSTTRSNAQSQAERFVAGEHARAMISTPEIGGRTTGGRTDAIRWRCIYGNGASRIYLFVLGPRASPFQSDAML